MRMNNGQNFEHNLQEPSDQCMAIVLGDINCSKGKEGSLYKGPGL